MRSKEDAKDYRYFPDPDLPPIHISDQWIEKVKSELPEFREEKAARYQSEFGLPEYDPISLQSPDIFRCCLRKWQSSAAIRRKQPTGLWEKFSALPKIKDLM